MSDRRTFEEDLCPICKNPAERGFLAGNSALPMQNLATMFREMEWFSGDPGALKRLMTLGDAVGKADPSYGPYATGIRCNACKKIILDI